MHTTQSSSNPGARSATRRRGSTGLTRAAVVDTAAELVSEHGFEALSMRAIAERCGVGVMTLYGYVRTREELLGALADRFFDEVELPDTDGLSWRERIGYVLRSTRRVFLAHPELVAIVATQRMDGIAAYRGAELVFSALREAGLSDEETVGAFNALSSFAVGSIQREIGLKSADGEGLPAIGGLPVDGFPNVIALAGLLATRDPEHDFELGLDLLIGGIASRVAT
jgi:AcrR family transcriptional regulator